MKKEMKEFLINTSLRFLKGFLMGVAVGLIFLGVLFGMTRIGNFLELDRTVIQGEDIVPFCARIHEQIVMNDILKNDGKACYTLKEGCSFIGNTSEVSCEGDS